MARHQSYNDMGTESDGFDGPVRHKENRQPFSMTKNGDGNVKSSNKQSAATSVASKRKAPAASIAQQRATTNSTSSKGGRKQPTSRRDEEDEEEDEQVIAETQALDNDDDDEDNDDEMEVDEPVNHKKKGASTKGKNGNKKTRDVVDAEGNEVDESRMSARERRLSAKLELTQKNLKQTQEAFAQLSELRTTKAEESEAALTLLASERQAAAMTMIENYKHENDSLRNELASLRARRAAGINVTDGERIEELLHVIEGHGEEKQALETRIAELEEQLAAASLEERRKLQERDHKWQKELERTVKAKDEEAHRMNGQLKTDLHQAQQELEAEIEHSKTLQARSKGVAAAAAAPSSSAADGLKLGRVTDELATVKKQLNLSEDLTGFTVVSVKNEEGCSVYSAILNDYLGRTGGLTFKLAFYADGTCGYTPDVDPERDAVLADLLPHEMQRYMRFDAENCSEWFRRLWFAVNKLKA